MSSFQFFVNGDWIEFDDFDSDWSLAHALRDRLGLTGTKIACGVGACGSCTVLVSRLDKVSDKVRHYTVNACVTPIYTVYGCHVLTIEGLTSPDKKIDKIQDAIARGNGTQCGFCTPGIVMSLYGSNKAAQNVAVALQGNLCRCTGYRPIIEAFQHCNKPCSECTEPCQEKSPDIEDQAESKGFLQVARLEPERMIIENDTKLQKIETLLNEFASTHQKRKSLRFETPNGFWLVPRNVKKLGEMISEFPNAEFVGGCTSVPIQSVPKKLRTMDIIDLSALEEMRAVEVSDGWLKLGGGLTLTEVDSSLDEFIPKLPEHQQTILKCLKTCIEVFGSPQIRNVATIGGTLASTKNYSDLQTFCVGFGVVTNYLKISESEDDIANKLNEKVVSHIAIPLSQEGEGYWFEKVSERKYCSTAIVNAAIKTVPGNATRMTFGGMALQRFSVESEKIESANVADDVDRNFAASSNYDKKYVQLLIKNLLQKIHLKLNLQGPEAIEEFKGQKYKSTRLFQEAETSSVSHTDLVHKAVPQVDAFKHVTGSSVFLDDIPKFQNEMEMAFVLSTKAHAKILSVDFSKALELDGVIGYVWHEDLPGEFNKFGLIERDEEVFASVEVTTVGQIIAGIVANDRMAARKAAKLVQVNYEDSTTVILTNEDAIANNSFYHKHGMTLQDGSCSSVLEKCEHVVSGEVKIGSQEHFYMEPQCCIAIPKEDGEVELISSTQNPTGVQLQVAQCLGLPANRVIVKVKRVGGGFGGKEIRCLLVALPVAAAARKFGRPARCILDRETDMRITGKRHIYLAKQKIGFSSDGRLEALKFSVYANAGNTLDVSMAPVERVLLNLDNAYQIENIDWEGFACKTNIPSNTVMRGTGAPQAAFFMENIMDIISSTLGKEPAEVRQLQLYSENDVTPYGQVLKHCNVRRCWEECLKLSNYYKVKKEIEQFNSQNQYVKRGISINPCHFGIGYTALHLNQGSALVHIYTDGSVMITHAGVELGQGVNSKMIQIATRELGISASKIRVSETSTEKVPNTTPSSASVTSDLQGMAVMNACRILIERLQPYWIQNPDLAWEALVEKAYMDRVSLTATGFYKAPDMGWDGNRGNPWNYFSTGVAATVVELDCLVGRFQILKTDIVMDVGQSLNPGIDVGQIEGAFMQGVGLFTLEEVIIDNSGVLLTADPTTYKIPTVAETPHEFNVSLLQGSENPKAIYSSKTVGEPPLLLATSVFFAVKEAIRAYRKSTGASPVFDLNSPATIKSILMACQVE